MTKFITAVAIVPETIHFLGGVVITPDKSLKSDVMAERIKATIDKLQVVKQNPCEVIYDLLPNTTGNPIAGFLNCFPWVMPTLNINNSAIKSINLKDGSSIAPDLFSGFKLLNEAIKTHQIDFKLDQQTGNYKLQVESEDVDSVTVSFGFGNVNLRPQV